MPPVPLPPNIPPSATIWQRTPNYVSMLPSISSALINFPGVGIDTGAGGWFDAMYHTISTHARTYTLMMPPASSALPPKMKCLAFDGMISNVLFIPHLGFFWRFDTDCVTEIELQQAQAFSEAWTKYLAGFNSVPTSPPEAQIEFQGPPGQKTCILTNSLGFQAIGTARRISAPLLQLDEKAFRAMFNQPPASTTCRCPIKNLLSTGHDAGCPEKK